MDFASAVWCHQRRLEGNGTEQLGMAEIEAGDDETGIGRRLLQPSGILSRPMRRRQKQRVRGKLDPGIADGRRLAHGLIERNRPAAPGMEYQPGHRRTSGRPVVSLLPGTIRKARKECGERSARMATASAPELPGLRDYDRMLRQSAACGADYNKESDRV
jgi:hypothetical protein